MLRLIQAISLILSCPFVMGSYEDAYELERSLFTNYSTRIRPVHNYSQPIGVTIAFRLGTIVSVDELQGELSVIGQLNLTWIDERLTWKPSDYGGVSYLHPYPKDVWRPRLELRNSLDDLDIFEDNYNYLYLKHTGEVNWQPGGCFPTLCILDLRKFPVDKHYCRMMVRPIYSYNFNIVFFAGTKEIASNDYTENGEWSLEQSQLDIVNDNDSTIIMIILVIQRRPNYFVMSFLIPVMLLSILNLLSFTMVVGDGSVNISYSMTVLLAYTIYVSILLDRLPSISMNMPYLAVYIFFLFVISLLTTVDIIFIVWLNNREEEEETKIKMESKLMNAMKKLISVKRLGANQTAPSKTPSSKGTSFMTFATQQLPTKNNEDTAHELPLKTSFPENTIISGSETLHSIPEKTDTTKDDGSTENQFANRPLRINKYKNLSESVRTKSLYIFIFLNGVVSSTFCILLAT